MTRKMVNGALAALFAGVSATTVATTPVLAEGKGIDEPFRAGYHEALNGKQVVFIPVAQAVDLAQGWVASMKSELEPLGVTVTVRDPNFNSAAGAQAIENLIGEKPAAIVVQNPDVQTYAKLLQQAEKAGIYVIQLNMRTSYNSSAFVGVDWVEMGEKLSQSVVKACEGKSGKIAIVQGALSAAASAYTLKGIENVLAKNPNITVVANQAADWDPSKAKAITQTVLKQHPDLCGIIGYWDGQDIGTAAAIKEAGMTGQVFLVTSGGEEQKGACDMVKSGGYDLYYGYNVPDQGRDVAAMIKWLEQSGVKSGTAKGSIYTTLTPISKANADGICWTLGK
jgi:ribose transport system substrate-binding protein